MSIDTEEPARVALPQVLGPAAKIALEPDSAYDRIFWLTYLANGLITVANAMLVRYADFVTLLGGEERQLGFIVGVGMVGGIGMRFVQGVGIDHYGSGRIWRWSTAVFSASLAAHLLLNTAHGPAVFVVRTIMQSSLAGIFGASITFVSLRVRPQRMAEMIGTLGTSGFIGILIGPLLSDRICGEGHIGREQVQLLFCTAATVAALAGVVTWFATRHDVMPVRRRRPSLWRVIHRYTQIPVAIVAVAMGAGFAIPMTFLRPFAAEMHLSHIGLYFAVYAVSAFVTRLATRQLFEQYGTRPWMILGMACLTISFALYLPVEKTWHLFAPGAIAGIAHAMLFPSVVSTGTTAFPKRYRGVATSMMLATFDFGVLLGAPVVGAFLQYAKQRSASPYSMMFISVAGLFLVITAFAAVSNMAKSPPRSDTRV
jgi:MFS family permease